MSWWSQYFRQGHADLLSQCTRFETHFAALQAAWKVSISLRHCRQP